MSETIIIKSLPAERGWKVTRDDKLVARYPTQKIAEAAAARLGRKEAKTGNKAIAMMHRGDGEVAGQRSYAPDLRSAPRARKVQSGE